MTLCGLPKGHSLTSALSCEVKSVLFCEVWLDVNYARIAFQANSSRAAVCPHDSSLARFRVYRRRRRAPALAPPRTAAPSARLRSHGFADTPRPSSRVGSLPRRISDAELRRRPAGADRFISCAVVRPLLPHLHRPSTRLAPPPPAHYPSGLSSSRFELHFLCQMWMLVWTDAIYDIRCECLYTWCTCDLRCECVELMYFFSMYSEHASSA
jgi:hypothetical protein